LDREKWKKDYEEWERWNPVEPVKGTRRPVKQPDKKPDPNEPKPPYSGPWLSQKLALDLAGLSLLLALGAGIAYVATLPASGTATAVVIIGVGLMGADSAEAGQPVSPSPTEPPSSESGPGNEVPETNQYGPVPRNQDPRQESDPGDDPGQDPGCHSNCANDPPPDDTDHDSEPDDEHVEQESEDHSD
jgi:hypothetical protein